MSKKVNIKLLCLSIFMSVSVPSFAVPSSDLALLTSKIMGVVKDNQHSISVITDMKDKIMKVKSFYDKNLKKEMEHATADAAIEGRKSEKISQLEYMKEMAPIGDEACNAVVVSKVKQDSVCDSINTQKVAAASDTNSVISKYSIIMSPPASSSDDKLKSDMARQKAFSAFQMREDYAVLDNIETSIGQKYGKSFKDGLEIIKPTGVINSSKFFMSDEGFDRKNLKQAYETVKLIVPSYRGDFISQNMKNYKKDVIEQLRRDGIKEASASVLRSEVAYRLRDKDGISGADMSTAMIRDMSSTGVNGFMYLVDNAPSIDMIPRYRLLITGQNVDVAISKFKSSLLQEYLLAIKLANEADK